MENSTIKTKVKWILGVNLLAISSLSSANIFIQPIQLAQVNKQYVEGYVRKCKANVYDQQSRPIMIIQDGYNAYIQLKPPYELQNLTNIKYGFNTPPTFVGNTPERLTYELTFTNPKKHNSKEYAATLNLKISRNYDTEKVGEETRQVLVREGECKYKEENTLFYMRSKILDTAIKTIFHSR